MSAVQNYFISYKYQGVTTLVLIRRIKYPIEKYNTKKRIKQLDLQKIYVYRYTNQVNKLNTQFLKFDNGVSQESL